MPNSVLSFIVTCYSYLCIILTKVFLMPKDLNRHNFAVAMEEVDLKTVSRWDRMNIDLLVKIFKQMNMLELLPISLVCRGWRHGCSDAWLWDTLDLGLLQSNFIPTRASPFVFVDEPSDRKLTRVLKLAFSLSQGNIRCLVFHYYLYMKDEHLNLIVERCPNLKRIVIPAWNRLSKPAIYRAIETWQGFGASTRLAFLLLVILAICLTLIVRNLHS